MTEILHDRRPPRRVLELIGPAAAAALLSDQHQASRLLAALVPPASLPA